MATILYVIRRSPIYPLSPCDPWSLLERPSNRIHLVQYDTLAPPSIAAGFEHLAAIVVALYCRRFDVAPGDDQVVDASYLRHPGFSIDSMIGTPGVSRTAIWKSTG